MQHTPWVRRGSYALAGLLLALLPQPPSAPDTAAAASSSIQLPAWASAPNLLAAHADGVVLVKYRDTTTQGQREAAQMAAGSSSARPVSPLAGYVERLELAPGIKVADALRRLATDPHVAYAEPDYELRLADTPNDPKYLDGALWGMYGDTTVPANNYGSQAAEVWAAGHTGAHTIYIGLLDEGVQIGHPDLDANMWRNPYDPRDGIDNDGNGYIDDERGWDFFHNDNTVYDGPVDNHGTHVAGTLGAEGGNGIGVVGVNWRVTLIPTKFVGPSFGYTSGAIAALDYLVDLKQRHGLNIVASNNSWAGDAFSQLMLDAINRAGDAEMLFVAAAGNGNGAGVGLNNDVIPNYPSSYQCTTRFDTGTPRGYDCAIAVASITATGARSTFSNYGAVSVDLGAPGSDVWSTLPGTYGALSGTSLATPHVTGGIALCASMNPALSARDLHDVVLGTVTPTASLAGVTSTGGRLNLSTMASLCVPVVGGRHLTITANPVTLSWIDGTVEAFYSLFRFQNGAPEAPVTLPATASSYTPGSLTKLKLWCYLLAAQAPAGLLGLSDLLCTMQGLQSGSGSNIPREFALSLRESKQAYLTWTAPGAGVSSYTLVHIPLDGGPATTSILAGGYTAAIHPVVDSGSCFQLTAHRFAASGSTDVVCGIPGVSTLGAAGYEDLAGSTLAGLEAALGALEAPAEER